MPMKRLAIALIYLTLACVGWARAEPAALRVGTSAASNPLIFQVDGKVVGLEVDLARLLQSNLGQPLQFKVLAESELFPALARGDIDMVMAGLIATPENEKLADFTQPYFHSGLMAIIRTDDVLRFRGSGALVQGGYRVGFVSGSAAATYVKSSLTAVTSSACATSDECLQALMAKRIDVLIDAPLTSWRIATDRQYSTLLSFYRPLNDQYFTWAVSKTNPQLRDRLNTAVAQMQATPMFEHILNRWIPVRIASD
jgi:polar amino acid transport system substrate-binding protein